MKAEIANADASNLSYTKQQLFKKLLSTTHRNPCVDTKSSAARRESYPLTFAQQRLWFLQQLQPGSCFYSIVRCLQLSGPLDAAILKTSLQELMRRHGALRTTFRHTSTGPVQVVAGETDLPFASVDLGSLNAQSRDPALNRLMREQFETPFDLNSGPLARFTLARFGEHEHVLVVCVHHIVTDDWSLGMFFRELSACYNAFRSSMTSGLPEPSIQYVDFALSEQAFLNTREYETQLSYWKQQLAESSPALNLPVKARLPIQTDSSATISFHVTRDSADGINELCRQQKYTFFVFLLGIFEVLLARFTGEYDLAIGTIISTRDSKALETVFGLMTNTVVLRLKLNDESSFLQVLDRAREVLVEAYENKDLPFEHLVRAMQPNRSNAHAPLFQPIVFLQNAYEEHLDLHNIRAELLPVANPVTAFDLSLAAERSRAGVNAALQYKTEVLGDNTAARLLAGYESVLKWALERPNDKISSISLLTEQERQQLAQWNNTGVEHGSQFVQKMFELQVKATPGSVAVSFANCYLSYRELNQKANQLARHLRTIGVGPEALVGICMERSIDAVVGLLAVLKAGGAYLPLDPDYPLQRLKFMAADAAIRVLLTHNNCGKNLLSPNVVVVEFDNDWSQIETQEHDDLNTPLSPENAAYVIYTSGSTGFPKGVLVPHSALANQLLWLKREFPLNSADRVLQRTSLSFDAATGEIFIALLSGARLVISEHAQSQDADYLLRLIADEHLTVVDLPPSLLLRFLHDPAIHNCSSLHSILCGGEVFPVELRDLSRTLNATIYNLYGPTETAIQSTFHRCSASETYSCVPIGQPIENTEVFVLGRAMELLPVGVAGELFISGGGLARGYLNRPELTAWQFVPDPFSKEPGGRLYRTGDRTRWNADGKLEYLGRQDSQIKIRGYRIEPGEVETALQAHPNVQQAVAVLRQDKAGQQILVAYLVASGDEQSPVDELRLHLKKSLPEYMVPWHFLWLDELPLSPAGKVDRNALPVPELSSKEYRGPRSTTEEILCGIFAQVLAIPRASIDDNFFALGGHSLLATQFVSRIRVALGMELPLRAVFEFPTVAELVLHLKKEDSLIRLTPQPRPELLPLSYAQQRLWFIDQMKGASPEYNMPETLRLRGALNRVALRRAIQAIVARHESLRTHFAQIGSEPVQIIEPELHLELPVDDLDGMEDTSQTRFVEAAILDEWERPFDLSRGPLLRFKLLKLAEQDHILLRTFHHIVSDGWSHGVFSREFMLLYNAYCEGQESPLSPLPLQYADFALWQRRSLTDERLAPHLDYWKKQLTGIPDQLALPADHARPSRQTFGARRLALRLSEESSTSIQRFSQRHDVTLYMTLIAAWAVLLQRYTGEHDIVIGSPIASRQEAILEQLIGFFVNSIVIRIRVDDHSTFREMLARVRATTLEAYAHQELPFEQLVAELSPQRNLNRTPLYQVAFALQNAPLQKQRLAGLTVEPVRTNDLRVRFDLELHAFQDGAVLELWWVYNRDLFNPWRIEQMAGHYKRLLEILPEHADAPVGSIDILNSQQRHIVLELLNPISRSIPKTTIVEMFTRQAEQTPQALAARCGRQQLTYQELDRSSAKLAEQLLNRGIVPEARVGLCVERSLEMVAGILGILKSGAAYVPLDPDMPPERLQTIIKDSGVALIVIGRKQLAAMERNSTPCLLFDVDTSFEQLSSANRIVSEHQLAYVIYTSGSTGKPKGVAVSHRNLVHSTEARIYKYVSQPKGYLLLSSFAFDSSIAGIFWVLSEGGTLHIPSQGTHNDVHELAELIRKHQITHLLCLPAFYSQMLEEGGRQGLNSLRTVIVAGESCPAELAERHYAILPNAQLYNEYGPTEGTVWSTVYDFHPAEKLERVPIGKPIANMRIYILNARMEPVPVGVAGELFLGGAGLARGYWNRPELTAERFLPDPFKPEPGERIYRTGDLGRWRPDGELEFLGRNDQQVKIRGYRIELGEIEAALRAHEQVKDAVVIAREIAAQPHLLGYVVLRQNQDALDNRQAVLVEQWKQLYESIYQQATDADDFNIAGWTSSYTGQPIPPDEMRIWVDETVARLRALQPTNVLEIGCGTGLLLIRLANHVRSYIGLDFSIEALDRLRAYLSRRRGMDHVTLRHGLAQDLSLVPDDSVDLVILNSVIQYFPSVDYLLQVLSEAVRVTRTGGRIFVGDVRSLLLAQAYYTSVHLHKARSEMSLEELRQQIAQAQKHEKELLVEPTLFSELAVQWKKLGSAEIALKPGTYDNELSRFRYDVTMCVEPKRKAIAPEQWVRWDDNGNWRKTICQRLQDEPHKSVGLSRLPDKRVAPAVKATRLSQHGMSTIATAGELRIAANGVRGEDPSVLAQMARELGVRLIWQEFGPDGVYDVVFNPCWSEAKRQDELAASDCTRFANSPLQAAASTELGRVLLDYLRRRLPEYMVPLAVTVLPSWPRTATGKLDRPALPSPERNTEKYSAPETSLQESLVAIWAEAMGISRVGVDDNFFDLGGHSLLIPRIRFTLREKLQREVAVMDFFAFPTIRALAANMEGTPRQQAVSDSEQRAEQHREFLLRRMQSMRKRETQKEMVE